MKQLSFFIITFIIVSILFGCGANNNNRPQTAVLSSGFFQDPIQGEIRVSAFDSMLYRNLLEEAAQAFEALHPGVKVNIETFSAMPEVRRADQGNNQVMTMQLQNDPQARSDYISRVNTNLMSGTGADLYAIDVLPLHRFVEGDVLENLEPYMENDPLFNRADYRENILDALKFRNGTWFFPLDYSFNYFAYDSTLIPLEIAAGFGIDKAWSAQELLDIGMDLYNGSYRLFNTMDHSRGPTNMFNLLLNSNIQSFVNLETRRPNFADGSFSSLLSSVRNYAEQGLIPRGLTGQQSAGQVMQQAMAAPTDRFFFKLNSNVSLITQFSRDTGRMLRVQTGGIAPAIEENDEIAGIEANAQGLVPFRYNQGFGINSRSENKATAWAFLKFLLSREMQLSTNVLGTGLPIHNEARQEKAELSFSGALMGGSAIISLNEQQRQSLEFYRTAVETLSDSINTFIIQDTSINDMIAEEVVFFFGGSRSADEVARVLQNKADLYLSE